MTTAEIKVTPATKGELGAATLEYWLSYPPYAEAGVRNPATGAIIAVPEGTVKAYLEKHFQELGGLKAQVQVEIKINHDAREAKLLKENMGRRKSLSPKEFLEGIKNETIQMNEPLLQSRLLPLRKANGTFTNKVSIALFSVSLFNFQWVYKVEQIVPIYPLFGFLRGNKLEGGLWSNENI